MLESDKTPQTLKVDDSKEFRFSGISDAGTGYRDIVSWWIEGGYGSVEVQKTMGDSPLPNPESMIEFGTAGEEMISNYRKLM